MFKPQSLPPPNDDQPASESIDELLTESEVADILRRSTEHVKRLRLSGALPYIPGRPPMVARSDLEAYIAGAKVGAPVPPPGPPLTDAEREGLRTEAEEAARRWLLNKKMQPPRRRRSTGD